MSAEPRPMSTLTTVDRRTAREIAALAFCNPFLPERIEHERAVLGDAFEESTANWNIHADWGLEPPNVIRLVACAEEIAERARARAESGQRPTGEEITLCEDLIVFVLYQRHRVELTAAAEASAAGREVDVGPIWDRFVEEVRHYLPGSGLAHDTARLAHLFAGFFQVCRAFHNIFRWIVGVSSPAARLRAAVWQSIFTHDMRRYVRVLFDRMGEYTTLITGPSGSGKDLVARAVGLSRYIPFDPRKRVFVESLKSSFQAFSLAAMSPTLIESELFGHKRGAYTGAVSDRKGWLETCPPLGAVFLDEIGELDGAIQVKLLRVVEDRTFSRLGETRVRRFHGKVIAATNRDLAEEMHAGRFRRDLFYRLCSDTIRTPSLCERLRDRPGERRHLVEFLARRLVGDEGAAVADEVEEWIDGHLGAEYAWPGNVRELDQCVRNILIRREYVPPVGAVTSSTGDPYTDLAVRMRDGLLTADELLRCYCALVYERVGSYEGAARALGLDRRTVKAKVGECLQHSNGPEGATSLLNG